MKQFIPFLLLTILLTSCLKVEVTDQISEAKGEIDMNNYKIPEDEKDLVLTDRTVIMETNFGTLNIKMLDKAAPKTTENFIRLTNRKYFDNLTFHRMVEAPSMKIIQGGDPQGNGTGGQSAFGQKFVDEIFDDKNDLIAPELYPNYDGQIATYQKGYLAMANSGPDTNGSQFFIMLGDTILPPSYTIFGQIDEADFSVLDKILEEVKPDSPAGDGKPDPEIKIIKAELD